MVVPATGPRAFADDQCGSISTNGTTNNSRRCLCQLVDKHHFGPQGASYPFYGHSGENHNMTSISAASAMSLVEEDDSATVRCSACVQRILKPYLDRHERARQDHQRAKQNCGRRLREIADPTQRLSELQAESQRLRDRLTVLGKECGDMAIRVASQAVENDAHRESLVPSSERQHRDLERLENGLLEGSLVQAIDHGADQVRVLRFQWARKVLAMHHLDIDPEDIKLTPLQKKRQEKHPSQQLQRRARGIAKIAGLPLPNAGPELYGVLPPMELQSALRLVAMVTSTVARCLGVVLPHPILLTLNSGLRSEDITKDVSEAELHQRRRFLKGSSGESVSRGHRDPGALQHDQRSTFAGDRADLASSIHLPFGSASTASLLSLMDGSYWTTKAKKVLAKATGQKASENISTPNQNTFIPPSTDATIVAQRLIHATAAVLADDDSGNSSRFSLATEAMRSNQDDFAIALQLLQNNVIVLCIRAGVPVAKLWPAEAMLLNLHELDIHCQQETAVSF